MIGFVFSILLILSFGLLSFFEKQVSSHRLCASYAGHIAANRHIFNEATSKSYNEIQSTVPIETMKKGEKKEAFHVKKEKIPAINPPCARFNLLPLIESSFLKEGSSHQCVLKLLKFLYGNSLLAKTGVTESQFFDAWMHSIREQMEQEGSVVLEKVSFNDAQLQSLYYKMLKGTKNHRAGHSTLSILDYFKIEPVASKICLFHAHPTVFSVFFSEKSALKIYQSIHTLHGSMTKECFARICTDAQGDLFDQDLFNLFSLNRYHQDRNSKITFIGEDLETKVYLRKVITFRSPRQ